MSPTKRLTPEHGHSEDTGTQLINIESVQQTIQEQVRKLEASGDETTVLQLRSLLPKLAGVQSCLRKSFDTYARTGVRKIHILNLPEELLVKIFEEVRPDASSRYELSIEGVKDIKSLRLTCRRFCDASSHLLIHELDVSLTYESLFHLDEVSRHPTISKGIRSLWIFGGLFKPLPGTGLKGFIWKVVEILHEDCMDDLDSMRTYFGEFIAGDRVPDFGLMGLNHHSLSQSVKEFGERNEIMISCTKYLQDETIPQNECRNLATLRQVYIRYKKLFDAQVSLLKHGDFVRRVAQAVARLPPGVSMTITDFSDFELSTLSEEILAETYYNVRERLLETSSWTPKVTSLLPQPPTKLLYELPNAVARAGNPLTRLRIQLDSLTEQKPRLSEQEAKDLISAAKHLKALEIDYDPQVRAEQHNFYNFVSLLSKGKNLRSVSFTFGRSIKEGDWSAQPLLALLPWAKLRKISLVNFPIHGDELSELLKNLTPGTYVELIGVCLLSGLWANLLDVLLAKATCNSEVRQVSGKEDQGLGVVEFGRQVGHTYDTLNPATKYIRGELSDNPLRSHPAQDNADQDGMDQDDVDGTI